MFNERAVLQQLHDQIVPRLRELNGRLSPMAHMPSEVICEIMAHALDEYGFSLVVPYDYPRCSALLSVCRRWRQIALSRPRFWSKILVEDW